MATTKQAIVGDDETKDINDIFNDILLSEESIIKDSYETGYNLGLDQENLEAYHLGYHRGAELGAIIGYISATVEVYLQQNHSTTAESSRKVTELLINIKELIAQFPRSNDHNVDIIELADTIKTRFKKLCALLRIQCPLSKEPLLKLANTHMVDFFTRDCYKGRLPLDIQDELSHLDQQEIINRILENEFDKTPILQDYIENCNNYSLKQSKICLKTDDFLEKLSAWGCEDIDKFKLDIFMSPKKSHEVEILSGITSAITKVANVTHLIDIGDGKGYLSSMLALHYKIPVLGIDASTINTESAVKRVKKLSKIWKGIPEAPQKSYPAKGDQTSSSDVNLYRQVTQFVNEDCNLQQLICHHFVGSPSSSLGLVGLHTCGNLASNSHRIFTKNDYIKSICNVGCCYHLLTEGSEKLTGFPMSKFLKEKNIVIGRDARMIASQSVDRVLYHKELPNQSIYYRALLQVLLEKYCHELPTKHVGKFKKPCKDFVEYSRKAMARLGLDINISDCELVELDVIYRKRLNELNIFYLLRCKLSPVVEALILLDRLLYLKESGFENSYLVQVFDAVVSPRCYAIISLKL